MAPTGTPADAILSRQAQIWPVYPTRSPAAGYTIEDIPTLRHWNEMALHRESSIPEFGEIPVITRNGDVRTWLLSRATFGRLPDRRNLALLAAVDLTEPHKTEEQLRKANLELEQYAFAASHDLQEQMRVTGRYIMREAARMTAVVSGLISYSRLVCESDPIQQQSVSLADLVTRIVSEFPQGADSQAAQITVEPCLRCRANPTHCRASSATCCRMPLSTCPPGGRPQIRISALRDRETWIVSMRDTTASGCQGSTTSASGASSSASTGTKSQARASASPSCAK
ncbi:MAG: hypothetical protein SGI92_20955 [Bryobacteraceae bacterium]|nr:hypothetical protein [Bryobacteraceae bacterium]